MKVQKPNACRKCGKTPSLYEYVKYGFDKVVSRRFRIVCLSLNCESSTNIHDSFDFCVGVWNRANFVPPVMTRIVESVDDAIVVIKKIALRKFQRPGKYMGVKVDERHFE